MSVPRGLSALSRQLATTQRISIVGGKGAGKTSLAILVGASIGVPVVHLDREFFLPNWQKPSTPTWIRDVEALTSEPRWVIEGNYFDAIEPRLARSELFIFLDAPPVIKVCRVAWRSLANWGRARSDLGQIERPSRALANLVDTFQYNVRRRQEFEHVEGRCHQAGIPWLSLCTQADRRVFRRALRDHQGAMSAALDA